METQNGLEKLKASQRQWIKPLYKDRASVLGCYISMVGLSTYLSSLWIHVKAISEINNERKRSKVTTHTVTST